MAGPVLKYPDDRKNRVVSAQATYPCGSQQLVAEFVSTGMRRNEFCRSRSLSFSTLDRHLKKQRWTRGRKPISSDGRLVPVELAARKSPTQQEPSCGLVVVLPG